MSKKKDELEAERIWGEFCKQFDNAVFECIEKGTPYRMTLGDGAQTVTIDVYRTEGDMKKFEELLKSAVNAQQVNVHRGPMQ